MQSSFTVKGLSMRTNVIFDLNSIDPKANVNMMVQARVKFSMVA